MKTDDITFIMRTTAFGGRDISQYKAVIPNLVVLVDYNHDAMGNFLNALSYTDGPTIQLEDDIELCSDFINKITDAVNTYPDHIINFFSLRKKDYELKCPYLETAAKFMMNQCNYIPAGYGKAIVEFYKTWTRKVEHPTGYDILMADWMKSKKMRYVQWFPHLVNHLECKSLINPKRSSKRTDINFQK
jgi:hypothetical protein